jgi:HSP20 family molecular chaperone IbpA
MAFYIYEQPAFAMEHFHPAFSQPLRTFGKPRHWNLIENIFDQEQMSCESNRHCSRTKSVKKSMEKSSNSSVQEEKMETQIGKSNDENKIVEPVTKTTSKQFMSRVSCHENTEKVEIKIQLHGHKFKAENLDVQVINDNILVVKAEDDKETFEKKFKLPSNVLVDKIESKFDDKEENTQTLAIHVPKDIKRTQVPISIEK